MVTTTTSTSTSNHLSHFSIFISLVVIVVVVPLVLYKIHVATNHLVLEGDNLRHWYIVNRMVESEKNPAGRPQTETEGRGEKKDVELTAGGEKFGVVSRRRSEGLTNYSLACSPQVIIREAVQNLLNNQTGSNSSKILIASKDISHIVLPADTEDNETRCGMERDLLTSMVENVLHVSQVNCRRKKKLIKIWHKPKPEPLLTSELPGLKLAVHNLITNFDSQHAAYGNKEYADLLWQRLENLVHYNGSSQAQGSKHSKLLFHVTVFNVENREEDFALRSRQAWRWEMMRRHSNGRPRVILVLALPPPAQADPVDLDLLDCLQQEAMMPQCSGPLILPHCAGGAHDKCDRVMSRCGGQSANSRAGIAVICWGCGVWHRWSRHFPVLHIQSQNMWNNLVWVDTSHRK